MSESKTKTSSTGATWEPGLLILACKMVSSADRSLARTSQIRITTDPGILLLPCSGDVDPAMCVRLLRMGLDGILVLGCHAGECRKCNGNRFADMKMAWTRLVLAKTQLGDGRVFIDWVSATEDQRFLSIVSAFVDTLRELGPNPVGNPDKDAMREELDAAILTLNDPRLRNLMGRIRSMSEQGNVYGEAVDPTELEAAIVSALEAEFVRKSILVQLKGREMTVLQLAERLGLEPETVMIQIVRLRQEFLLDMCGMDGLDPSYRILGGT